MVYAQQVVKYYITESQVSSSVSYGDHHEYLLQFVSTLTDFIATRLKLYLELHANLATYHHTQYVA